MEQQQAVSIGHQLAGRLAWKMVAEPQHKKRTYMGTKQELNSIC